MSESNQDTLEQLRAENAQLRARLGGGGHRADRSSEASYASADLLFTAADKTQMAMVISDPNLPDNPIVYANRAFAELSGYSREELIGRNCRFLQGEGTDPAEVARLRTAIAARRDVVVEVVNHRRDGSTFRNELYVSPVFDADGKLRYFFGSQLDVTRFRDRERQAADGIAPYRLLFEAMDAGFCVIEMVFDGEGRASDYRFIEVNAAFERQSGLGDVRGRRMRDLVPEHEQHWFDIYGGVARTGRTARFRSTAAALHRAFDVHAVRVGDASLNRVAVVFTDITSGKAGLDVSDRYQDSQAPDRDLIWRISRDLLVICGFDGLYRAVNPAWTTLLGWPPGKLIGTRLDALVHPADRDAVHTAFDRIRSSNVVEADVRLLGADGAYRWFAWAAVPQGDCFYATGRDITERRKLAEDLRQSQKIEAIGRLTGGVAHDFNNLLTVIKSSTELLKRPNLLEERRVRYIGAISDTVDRAAKLTGQLLAFARRQALTPEVFAAADGVRGLADMMRTLVGARVKIVTELSTTPCFINADTSQFDTALINLAVNARDAMNGEGQIVIAVSPVESIPEIRTHPAIEGPYLAVSLADTGSGIPPELMERIFEPFFTTKGMGKGTGLGLSQVFGFAKQSGGDLAVASTVGEGTTFTIYLPRVAAPEMKQEADNKEASSYGDGLSVLIVEDNVEVGTFAVQTLCDLGYRTVFAADGPAALVELEKGANRFDVVFSDVMMPGMSGVELGREVRRLHPNLPVVLTSGYSEVLAQEGTYGFELLHKPYSVEQLSQKLRAAALPVHRKRSLN